MLEKAVWLITVSSTTDELELALASDVGAPYMYDVPALHDVIDKSFKHNESPPPLLDVEWLKL